MAAQDVRELVPRVRRALEGPVAATNGLSEAQIEAVTADAIADLILLTAGEWEHTLTATSVDPDTEVQHYAVEPELSLAEQSLVAAQAALTQVFHVLRDAKVSETIRSEGQEWSYDRSANVLRDWLKALQDQRDKALEALEAGNPIMVRVSSILAVRDRLASAVIEPWLASSGAGGYELNR
jgi:hypothetical protein